MSEEVVARAEENEAIKSFIAHRDAGVLQTYANTAVLLCAPYVGKRDSSHARVKNSYAVPGVNNQEPVQRWLLICRRTVVSHITAESHTLLAQYRSAHFDCLAIGFSFSLRLKMQTVT